MILSPISGKEALIVENYNSLEFINAWEKSFSIDVSNYFSNVNTFYKCICPSSQYEFFFPFKMQGSSEIYKMLSKFEWYYMQKKWEYKVSIERLKSLLNCKNILEVGCGFGDFLDMCASEGINGMGIELNQEAVSKAKNKGRNVKGMDIQELEKRKLANFDAVVSFQVLEHIADPLPFIRSCINLLAPGGVLIITVPDGHGFCGRTPQIKNLLDSPPHHMGKWNISTFQYLTKIFPIRLDTILYEPLQDYHLDWYLYDMLSVNGEDKGIGQKIMMKIIAKSIALYVKKYDVYHNWKGHTLLVVFITNDKIN